MRWSESMRCWPTDYHLEHDQDMYWDPGETTHCVQLALNLEVAERLELTRRRTGWPLR